MYPSSIPGQRFLRTKVDNEPASFYAGTQFRTFKEITLAPAATYIVKMTRPVDIVIRQFALHVNTGEMRCEIYRNGTPSGSGWVNSLPVIAKCEFTDNPPPAYVAQATLTQGGTFTGGTLYDLMHVKTAGATGQASTVGDSMDDQLGTPSGSVGIYQFSNPGNTTAAAVFTMWWEELPVK